MTTTRWSRRKALGLAALLPSLRTRALPLKRIAVSRVGVLWLGDVPSGPAAPESAPAIFSSRLHQLGWVEGQNIALESRFVGDASHSARQIEELIAMRVEVLVAMGTPIASAVKYMTSSVPTVFSVAGDPIEAGLIDSLRRPGGNLTGIYTMTAELAGKRLALLHEAAPSSSTIAVLQFPNLLRGSEYINTQTAAQALSIKLVPLQVGTADDFESAINSAKKEGATALSILTESRIKVNLGRLAALSLDYRLPAIATYSDFALLGGLMSYGPSGVEAVTRTAEILDKVLRGARPSDLPVELNEKYVFIVNAKTAAALGLTVPQSLLQYADLVI